MQNRQLLFVFSFQRKLENKLLFDLLSRVRECTLLDNVSSTKKKELKEFPMNKINREEYEPPVLTDLPPITTTVRGQDSEIYKEDDL